MSKVKLLKKVYSGGLKQKEEIIEVEEDEADELCNNATSLDIFYTKIQAN